MIIFLSGGIVGVFIGLFLICYNIYIKKESIEMRKRCVNIVNGTFVRFIEKEILNSNRVDPYTKYFFALYEYFVDGKRYEVQSIMGLKTNNENLIDRNKVIRYNPNKIDDSFIEGEDFSIASKSVKVLGIVFLSLGIFWILLYLLLKKIY